MNYLKKHHLFLFIPFLLMLVAGSACSRNSDDKLDAVEDRSALPGLAARKITTVISDSGITRYRIQTDEMEVFDKAGQPYWNFPKGLYFERFAPDLSIDANFECEEAKFLEIEKLWEFRKHVKAINLEGEMFETDLLYWDEKEKRIYSDKFIRITRKTGVTTGVGFESNETMTRWSISNPKSDMYVKEESEE